MKVEQEIYQPALGILRLLHLRLSKPRMKCSQNRTYRGSSPGTSILENPNGE